MNFTEKLIADQAALAAELATLRETVAALTAPKPKPEPAKVDSRPDPIVRGHARDDEEAAATMARIHQRNLDHKALEASYMAKRREGLPTGQYRDDCNIIRFERDGKVVPQGRALEKQLEKAAEHEKAAIAEDLAWRKAVELPIRVNGYLPEADDE